MKARLRILLLLTVITVLFYWRFLLSHQFSLLIGFEAANQAYAWLNYWVTTVQQGIWPLWDPYTFSGHSFPGEMQTGAFYPFYLVLALFPLQNGTLSPGLYHVFYALSHVVCAFFMYLLARELHLSTFAALLAGICFSLGGYVVRLGGWPHQLGSALWLPLICVFLLRALAAPRIRTAVSSAAAAGLCFALAVLAGSLHIVLMEALVIFSLVVFYAANQAGFDPRRSPLWTRAALVLAICGGLALAGGAVQLLPAAEYSNLSFRFAVGAKLPSGEKIPYANLSDAVFPHALMSLLVAGIPGNLSSGEYVNPYIGVFPLLLAVIGVWKEWSRFWVRYLAVLFLVVFLYSLGPLSFLHGVFYAVAPLLWLAREPDRFLFLADFALALLAAFGIDSLLRPAPLLSWQPLSSVLRWLVIACAAVLGYQAFLGHGEFNMWVSFSILMIFLSYALFRYLIAGHYTPTVRVLIVSLVLFDLYAFDWSARNITEETARHDNEFDRLLSFRRAADYLKAQQAQTGLFRVESRLAQAPNFGDLFGIQTTLGPGATLVQTYERFRSNTDLLNVRYIIRAPSDTDPWTVYKDPVCTIYEQPHPYPRLWLVHHTAVEPDPDKTAALMKNPAVDLHRTALLDSPLPVNLRVPPDGSPEKAVLQNYWADRLEMAVETQSPGLLVLSEIFYPGWKATVNGMPAPVWKVDGMLRGIVVPPGKSSVAVYYLPATFLFGLSLSVVSFLTGAIVIVTGWRR